MACSFPYSPRDVMPTDGASSQLLTVPSQTRHWAVMRSGVMALSRALSQQLASPVSLPTFQCPFLVVQKCCATRVIQLVERSPVHQRPAAILQHVYAELPCLQSRGACMQRNVSERCCFLQHSTLATGRLTGMDPNLLSLTSSAARANFILSLQPR